MEAPGRARSDEFRTRLAGSQRHPGVIRCAHPFGARLRLFRSVLHCAALRLCPGTSFRWQSIGKGYDGVKETPGQARSDEGLAEQ